MKIVAAIDELRGRVCRLQGKRTSIVLGKEAGVGYKTVQAFLNGEPVKQQWLERLEQWCNRQEELTHAPSRTTD